MTRIPLLSTRLGTAALFASLSLPLFAQTERTGSPEVTRTDQTADETVELSPFEVKTSTKNIGYYTENTLAGTRLNTRLSDLGASITIVTKQQLEDTASVDINDVFLYEANTEGTGQYTNFTVDRNGGVTDQVQSSPQTSNRVRGIGRADNARDYFVSTGRLPLDAYNIEDITINRGPNSILFGLGSAAGIVNQTPAKARLNTAKTDVSARVGSYGSYRGTFNTNIPVLKDRLSVYFAAMHEEERFKQEPAYDTTRRLYGTLTFKPFSKTILRVNVEDYYNDSNRPNSITPRDYVTPYLQAGSPSWDPWTYTATLKDGSTVKASATAQLPLGLGEDPNAGPAFFIDQGVYYPYRMQRRAGNGYPGIQNANQPMRMVASQHPYKANTAQWLLFVVPGVTDRSLFDYENINITSTNQLLNTAGIYNVTLEQEVIKNLFVELGWYKEEYESMRLTALSGGSASVYIDPNRTLLDGTPNPYFRRPYLESAEPSPTSEPEDNEILRATLAYEYDFAKHDGWLRWLGRHRIMGLGQDRKVQTQVIRWREAVLSNHAWNASSAANRWTGPAAQIRFNRRYYVGDDSGRITYAPGESTLHAPGEPWTFTQRSYVWQDASGNPVGAWTDEQVTGGLIMHNSSANNQQETKSMAWALQSYLWEDRIVGTVGWRRDENQARSSLSLTGRDSQGFVDPAGLDNYGPWTENSGSTWSRGIVYHVLPWATVHFNRAESFTPSTQAVDLYGNQLPLPTGVGKDYGVSFTLLKEKLYVRANWYDNSERDSRTDGDTKTIVTRVRRMDTDFFIPFWEWQVRKRNTGSDGTYVSRGEGQAIYDPEIAKLTKLPDGFFDNGNTNYNDTRTVNSKGVEISVIYNPLTNWNIKFNVAQQKTIETNSAPRIPQWLGDRLGIWQDAVGFDGTKFWDTVSTVYRGTGTDVPKDWYSSVIYAPLSFLRATEGKPRPQVREWRMNMITNYRFDQGMLKGFGFGGAVRWEDRGAIGFKGISTGQAGAGVLDLLDPDQPVWDPAHTSVDSWLSYTTRIMKGKVRMKLQFNVRDVFENGGLEAVAVNPDGSPSVHRIVQPRTFMLTSSFSF